MKKDRIGNLVVWPTVLGFRLCLVKRCFREMWVADFAYFLNGKGAPGHGFCVASQDKRTAGWQLLWR